jgi:hypothetical protein
MDDISIAGDLPPQSLEAIAQSLQEFYEGERDEALARVASIERQLGYGADGRPTTAQIREWWRKCKGVCPHCGERI